MVPASILQYHKYNNILIDVFACAHLMYHSLIKKEHRSGDLPAVSFPGKMDNGKSRVVYGQLVQSLISFFETFENTDQKIYLLFDNPLSKVEARAQLSTTYKENRKSKMNPIFYRTIDFVQFYCTNTFNKNYTICRTPLREADDLAKVLLDYLEGPSLMIANDSDWFACLKDNPVVHQWWFLYGKDDSSIYTPKNFLNEYHFPPTEKAVVLYKALMGDKADCIEGICKAKDLSEQELLYIIDTYQNDAENLPILINLDEKVSSTVKTVLRENRGSFRINLKLVDRIDTPLETIKKYMWKGKNNLVLKSALSKILQAIINDNPLTKDFNFGQIKLEV